MVQALYPLRIYLPKCFSRGWALDCIYANFSRGRALDFIFTNFSRGRALDFIYTLHMFFAWPNFGFYLHKLFKQGILYLRVRARGVFWQEKDTYSIEIILHYIISFFPALYDAINKDIKRNLGAISSNMSMFKRGEPFALLQKNPRCAHLFKTEIYYHDNGLVKKRVSMATW